MAQFPRDIEEVDIGLEWPDIDYFILSTNLLQPILIHSVFSRLKCIYLSDYYLRNDLLLIINDKLVLKKFSFSVIGLKWQTLVQLSTKQTQLSHLKICWTHFVEYNVDIQDVRPFLTVTYLALHQIYIKPQNFKHLLQLFPRIKTFRFSLLNICEMFPNDFNRQFNYYRNCKTCREFTFRFIPRFDSITTFVLRFSDISQSFIESLTEYKNLKSIRIYCYLNEIKGRKQLEEYDWNLKKIIFKAIEICDKNKKKVFKLSVPKNSFIPTNVNIPRNLSINKLFLD